MIRALFTRVFPAAALSAALVLSALPAAFAQPASGDPSPKTPAKARAHTPAPAQPGADASGAKSEKSSSKKGSAAPPGLKASPIGTFGQWNVFAAGEGRKRICYAISQPQQRLPKTLTRDPAYLFVTVRRAENVANEIALIMGFPLKAPAVAKTASAASSRDAAATKVSGSSKEAAAEGSEILVGRAKFALVGKDKNAWLHNAAEESKLVGEMGRQKKLTVKAISAKGNEATDEYSLQGFGEALKRTREECK